MDSEGEHNREESSASPERETVQELEINVSLPTSSSDNLELGSKVLTRVMREVLEKVFDASLVRNGELIQGRCEDCGKKRDRSSPRLEPRSTKHVRTHLSDSRGSASSGASVPCLDYRTAPYSINVSFITYDYLIWQPCGNLTCIVVYRIALYHKVFDLTLSSYSLPPLLFPLSGTSPNSDVGLGTRRSQTISMEVDH
ncbi:hypothetical protein J1N35_022426 [Gossypium stocksii]|uniref:Uncharacterized protein n=1 Tax=Gossypium stocksii TaxID=47602 RepID=A0A9D3VGG5_9ROSI|nr:hypothetical protein J1N35_022426 [Gossypium stocksii]